MRVPQAADAAVIKSFDVTPGVVQFIAPASNAIPGGFWKRKILSGRLADPARPGEVNISFTLAQRFHLRPGDPLRVVLNTRPAGGRLSCSMSPASMPRTPNSRRSRGMAPLSPGAPPPSTASTGRWTDSTR